jgi:hypothetical protein
MGQATNILVSNRVRFSITDRMLSVSTATWPRSLICLLLKLVIQALSGVRHLVRSEVVSLGLALLS